MPNLPAYSYDMLPICGSRRHQFATQREAQRFADWAERFTRKSQRPCEAFIECRDDLSEGNQWEVKVRNW